MSARLDCASLVDHRVRQKDTRRIGLVRRDYGDGLLLVDFAKPGCKRHELLLRLDELIVLPKGDNHEPAGH